MEYPGGIPRAPLSMSPVSRRSEVEPGFRVRMLDCTGREKAQFLHFLHLRPHTEFESLEVDTRMHFGARDAHRDCIEERRAQDAPQRRGSARRGPRPLAVARHLASARLGQANTREISSTHHCQGNSRLSISVGLPYQSTAREANESRVFVVVVASQWRAIYSRSRTETKGQSSGLWQRASKCVRERGREAEGGL